VNTAEDLIGAAGRQVAGLLDGRTLATSVDTSRPALVGRFDFVQALRILNNLIENALRHSPPGSPVDVGVRREGDNLLFAVADRGPGIAAEERERIFEPFYRSATSAPDVGHAGLGLSIARRLAEIQSGSLDYEPRPGGGSVFTLRLPAIDILAES
jgi:signal transduction histidine kinase